MHKAQKLFMTHVDKKLHLSSSFVVDFLLVKAGDYKTKNETLYSICSHMDIGSQRELITLVIIKWHFLHNHNISRYFSPVFSCIV